MYAMFLGAYAANRTYLLGDGHNISATENINAGWMEESTASFDQQQTVKAQRSLCIVDVCKPDGTAALERIPTRTLISQRSRA